MSAADDIDSKDLTADFNRFCAEEPGYDAHRPTLAALKTLVEKMQQVEGVDISLDIADLDVFNAYKMQRSGPQPQDYAKDIYGVIKIFDAAFLVRIKPDNIIHIRSENINTPGIDTSSIFHDKFWFNNDKLPRFHEIDLGDAAGCKSFCLSMLDVAAGRAQIAGIKQEYSAPQKAGALIFKK